jgi:hypothetical protein
MTDILLSPRRRVWVVRINNSDIMVGVPQAAPTYALDVSDVYPA